MPEGPSIVILKEAAADFAGKTVRTATGNSRLDLSRMEGRRIKSLRSWGKHFLIEFAGFSMRVHLMMFGSCRINERKETPPRMSLCFDRGELNFYTCSLKYIEGGLDESYDWSGDVLSDAWDPAAARRKLKASPNMRVCDALLQQSIFAGVGNIIKNEVLFRIRLHPESRIGALSARKLGELICEAQQYSFDFLAWKKDYVLRKHWLVHTKSTCTRCSIPLRLAHLGTTHRRSFWCERCQVRYGTEHAE